MALIVIMAPDADAGNIILEDDFTGANGAAPDGAMWSPQGLGTGEAVDIQNNELRVLGNCRASSTVPFNTTRFTVIVDAMAANLNGRCIDVRANSKDGDTTTAALSCCYDTGWGWHYWTRRGGSTVNKVSYTRNLGQDVWVNVNITVWDGRFNITVIRNSDGAKLYEVRDQVCDPFNDHNAAGLGGIDSNIRYDDITVRDLSVPPNKPPQWLQMPTLTAVEDVKNFYNFNAYVSDVDNEMWELYITSSSPFVTGVDGLDVTFLFPNNVLEADVHLELHDGYGKAQGTVHFIISPVNDPPSHSIPSEILATEDLPFTMDMRSSVWDIDNDTADLSFVVFMNPYVTADGLNLTGLFPGGVTRHLVWFDLTDGLDEVTGNITFVVQAVDDSPEVDPLPVFMATEDSVSVFNMTPFLHDEDTAIEKIKLLCRDGNCTVNGQELRFLYTLGGEEHNVSVSVTDGRYLVVVNLVVWVREVNDAPVVYGVPPKMFTEDEPGTVELEAYMEDEDDDLEDLTLICDHPAVVDITGFDLTMDYTMWEPAHVVTFQVTDGVAYTEGSFEVQVEEVNDPPSSITLGDLVPPVVVIIDEGDEVWLDVHVHDEEDDDVTYSLSSDWPGVIVFRNGTLRVTTTHGEVGEFEVTLAVTDSANGTSSLTFWVDVRNVNEPPTKPLLVSPVNHTMVEVGDTVTFRAETSDPDMPLGDVVTVTWVSNISGILKTLHADGTLEFITNHLPVGDHRITVSVTDGEFVVSSWLEIFVVEAYVPPPPPPEDPGVSVSTTGIMLLVAVVLIVIVAVAFVMSRRTVEEEEREEREEPEEPEELIRHGDDLWVADKTDEEGVEEAPADLRSLSEELGRMATALEAQRDTERAAQPPPSVLPQMPVVADPPSVLLAPPAPAALVLTAEEEADMEHVRDVREVMMALTQLPRGLPTAVWGKDMTTLGREIVDGEKRTTSDGTELVNIDGKWYESDHTNLGRFLHEHKERVDGGDMSSDAKQERLDKLEDRLLEGKISEETYERLLKKYTS